MFKRVGKKIMALAKILCWLGILGSIGFVIYSSLNVFGSNWYEYLSIELVTTMILEILMLCLGSWISSLFIYAFGKLVDNSETLVKIYKD